MKALTRNLILSSLIMLLFSGCSEVGYKSVFVPQGQGEWQKPSYDRYAYYKCDDASVEIDPILVRWDVYAAGPVVPLIPMGPIVDNRNKNLQIDVRVTGNVARYQEALSKLSIVLDYQHHVMKPDSTKRIIQLSKVPGQYMNGQGQPDTGTWSGSFSFPLPSGKAKTLSIDFVHEIGGCVIPPVTLTLKSGNYGEFTAAPGP